MFEKFNVPAFYVTLQPTLSLYASGRHGGVIVDVGEGLTHITPIMGGPYTLYLSTILQLHSDSLV